MRRGVCGVLAVVGVALPCAAEPVFLATNGTTLYRTTMAGIVQTFDLGTPITSMAKAPDGTVWAAAPLPGTAGGRSLYILEGAMTSTPYLREVSREMERNYSAMTFMGPKLFAFDARSDIVVRINTDTYEQTIHGRTGDGNRFAGGAAFDRTTGLTYLGLNSGDFLVVDLRRPAGTTELGTKTGDFGIDVRLHGFEFHRGVLYAAVHRTTSDRFDLGTIDLQTGAFSYLMTIDENALGISVGLTVIPAPAGAGALLAAAGLVALRRRR